MIATESWVLYQSSQQDTGPAELKRETYHFPEIEEDEVLAAPIYGCWEANMTHALKRHPVDICRLRREKRVVLGNAGVVRILETGKAVTSVREGDLCAIVPIGQMDPYEYMVKVYGYDAPGTIGLLAKKIKLQERQVIRLPDNSRHTLRQWAAFSVRYATAWDNWKVAFGCLRLQMPPEECPVPFVWGWGGGMTLAELCLAKSAGCRVAMLSSNEKRLELIGQMGITPIDRREFMELHHDERRYESDHRYKATYLQMEKRFLDVVKEKTEGAGVSIFIDNIGTPVLRASLKALSRQGVLTTAGWDKGASITFARISECINRHILVHTHGARYSEGVAAVRYANETGWLPPVEDTLYSWDDIPQLAHDYAAGRINTYFPIFQVNPAE